MTIKNASSAIFVYISTSWSHLNGFNGGKLTVLVQNPQRYGGIRKFNWRRGNVRR